MFALIFEYGMVTLSWYAWLALRRRVSMSAIGSVMVMCSSNPSRRGSEPDVPRWPTAKRFLLHTSRRESLPSAHVQLPGGLRDARQLATVGHLTDADAAQPEFAVDRLGSATPLAAG